MNNIQNKHTLLLSNNFFDMSLSSETEFHTTSGC